MNIRQLMFLLIVVLLIGLPSLSPAQNDGYPGPTWYNRPPGPPWPPPATGWYYPYFQRSMKNYPQMIKKWQLQRSWLDFEHLQRNPLNPESTLDYMMRTF